MHMMLMRYPGIRKLCIILSCMTLCCAVLLQAPVCHAELIFPKSEKKWLEGYRIYKERCEIIEQRYREVFEPATPEDGWTPFHYPYLSVGGLLTYLHDPQFLDNLKTDIYLKDFLSFGVGQTTHDEVLEAVGIWHMNYGTGTIGYVYLTVDGYFIAFEYNRSNNTGLALDAIAKAYIQHVDWEDERDFETFRLDTLAQLERQAQLQQLKQILPRYVLIGGVVISTIVLAVVGIKRRKK